MLWPSILAAILFSGPPPDLGSEEPPPQASLDLGTPEEAAPKVDVGGAEPLPPEPEWVEPVEPAEPRPNLRVIAAGHAPFVTAGNDGPGGIALEIWKEVADQAEVDYQVQYIDNVPDAVALLAAGKADALVGPISVTARRAQRVAFTQPYHQAALSVLATEGSAGILARFRPFVTQAFIVGVSALFFVLFVVGTLLWLTERGRNEEHFPSSPIRGIGNGIWLALVTMTTVGYGDRVPLSVGGRVVAGVWMLISMLTASSLTASIATALTLSGIGSGAIERADQLARQRVAAVRGTPSEDFVRRHRGRLVEAEDVASAIAAVESGDAVAVVYDRPILRDYIASHPETDLVLSEIKYEPRGYGFALAKNTEHLERINIALLELTETGRIAELIDRQLGED